MPLDIRDYDIAMVERIKVFFDNTFFINRPLIPIKEIRDRKILDGKDVEFPLITVRRINCPVFSKEYNSWSRAKSGQNYFTHDTANKSCRLQNIDPELADKITVTGHYDAATVVNSTFELTYYIDVISLERDNFDTLLVELQENLFTIPYIGFYNYKSDGHQDKLVHGQACHLFIEDVEDTSNIENFDTGNALYRATITAKINAYIYRKFKSKTVEKFNLEIKKFDFEFETIEDFINYYKDSNVWQRLGFSSQQEFIDFINSFATLEDLLNYIHERQNRDANWKLGPDLITLIYNIPKQQ